MVAPERLCVLGFLPSHSPQDAAAELERCASIGHRGAIIDVFEIDLLDRAWDRLWAVGEETRLPIRPPKRPSRLPSVSPCLQKMTVVLFGVCIPSRGAHPVRCAVVHSICGRTQFRTVRSRNCRELSSARITT